MDTNHERGFTLLELAMVVLIFGIVLGFSIPAFMQYGRSHNLHGAAENMAAQFRLARQRALSTGFKQHFHISGTYVGYDYSVHPWTTSNFSYFSFPQGVNYTPANYTTSFFMNADGRSSNSFAVRLVDTRGDTATVSVQLSGLVTVY